MATTLILPPPPSGAGNNWNSAWAAYQANPVGGYAAYYNFLKAGQTSGPILAAGNYPVPGSASAPDAPGGGTGGTGAPPPPVAGTGTGAVPLGTPTPINVGGQANTISRFGPGGLGAYNVGTSYAGQESPPGAPSSVPPPSGGLLSSGAPAPAQLPATPAQLPASSPVPSNPVPPIPGTGGSGVPAPGGGTGGLLHGGGQSGYGGNDRAGGFTGNNGGGLLSSGGNGPAGNPANPNGGQPAGFFNFGPNQGIDIGPWGAGALQAASTLAPFPYGLPFTAAQLAMRGYNLANGDAVRKSLGGQEQDFGQILGGLLGTNDRGSISGNQTFFNREENKDVNGHPVAVTQGGYYDPGFLQRLFTGDQEGTAYTPEEKRLRDMAAANAGNAGGASYGAVRNPGSSGASMTTGAAGVRGIGAGNFNPKTDMGKGSGLSSGGGNLGNQGSGNAGLGGAGSTSNTNAAGQASNATGQIGERGIGGGTYAKGGYVNSRPSLSHGERDLAFAAMAERFGPEKAAAIMNQIAPAPGPMQGPPVPPGYAQRIAPRPDMLGMTPGTDRMPVNGPSQMGGFSPGREAEMMAEMDADTMPLPGQKPPQPGMGIEGGWPIGLLSAKPKGKGKPGPSESDLLNMAELARHQPQNLRGGGRVAGKPDRIVDNRAANVDEQEFVVRKSAARAAGPKLLGLLNTPAGAKKMRGLLSAA